MVKKRSLAGTVLEIMAILATVVLHWVIFYFIIINSFKPKKEAARLSIGLPKEWYLTEN